MNAFLVYILNLFALLGVAWWLQRRWGHLPLGKHLLPGLLLRVAGGIASGLVYQFYYQEGDPLTLFQDALFLSNYFRENPANWLSFFFTGSPSLDIHLLAPNPRAVLFTMLLSAINLLTLDNFWLTGIYLSVFSFIGTFSLGQSLATLLPHRRKAILLAFFYWPSLLFWSGGIMKETLLIGSIGLAIHWSFQLFHPNLAPLPWPARTSKLAGLLIACLLIYQLKYYYAGSLFPALAAYFLVVRLRPKSSWLRRWPVWSAIAFYVLILAGTTRLHPNLYPEHLAKALVKNHHQMAQATLDKANLIKMPYLTPSLPSLIAHLPQGIMEGTTRPWIWEPGSWLKKLAALERIGMLALLVLALYVRPKLPRHTDARLLLTIALLYLLPLLCLLPIASPNLGNLVRYQTGIVPFIVFFLANPAWNNFQRLISKLKNTHHEKR